MTTINDLPRNIQELVQIEQAKINKNMLVLSELFPKLGLGHLPVIYVEKKPETHYLGNDKVSGFTYVIGWFIPICRTAFDAWTEYRSWYHDNGTNVLAFVMEIRTFGENELAGHEHQAVTERCTISATDQKAHINHFGFSTEQFFQCGRIIQTIQRELALMEDIKKAMKNQP